MRAAAGLAPVGFINPLIYSPNSHVEDVLPRPGLAQTRYEFVNGLDTSGGVQISTRTIDDSDLNWPTTPGWDERTGMGIITGDTIEANVAGRR